MAEIKKIESLEEYNEFIARENTLNVVKLGADWCGQCKVLERTIKDLTAESIPDVLLGEVDVDDEWFEDKADELGIRGIPVLLAFKGGVLKDRLVGLVSSTAIIDFCLSNK